MKRYTSRGWPLMDRDLRDTIIIALCGAVATVFVIWAVLYAMGL